MPNQMKEQVIPDHGNPIARHIIEVRPGIFRWEAHSPRHKVALTSHAFLTAAGLFIFDPIRVSEAVLSELAAKHPRHHLVLSNVNHTRDARWWSERVRSSVTMRGVPSEIQDGIEIKALDPSSAIWQGWRMQPIEGGPQWETAFHPPETDAWIFGDALVNLQERGLEVLPEKYCLNQELLRKSLGALVDADSHPFKRAFFAHGLPLLEGAREQIRHLLMSVP